MPTKIQKSTDLFGALSDFSIMYQHIAYLVMVSMKSLMIQSTRVAKSNIPNH